jgi:Bacterial transglutaminase-like N-terminal region
MTILHVRHTTVYRYRRPVRLGDHRLMLCPRDSHDLRLIRTNLILSHLGSVRWIHEVFGTISSYPAPSAPRRRLLFGPGVFQDAKMHPDLLPP